MRPSTMMHVARQKIVNRASSPALQRAPSPAAVVQPVRVSIPSGAVQLAGAMKVSSPSDPAEREAERTAHRIMRIPVTHSAPAEAPANSSHIWRSPYVARLVSNIAQRQPLIFRKGEGPRLVTANMAAEINGSQSSGDPLPTSVKRFMEPRFGARFDRVRIHTGDRAAKLNRQVNARAFTVGNQIFFGRGSFQPDNNEGRELIAHELTHTIQQGAAVQRTVDLSVGEHSELQIQRFGLGDFGLNQLLSRFADAADNIPGFRMLTIVIGLNPITMNAVERSPANIMRAIVEFLPGGAQITQALDKYGVFDKVAHWVQQQFAALGMVGSAFKRGLDAFLSGLDPTDFIRPMKLWEDAKSVFTGPVDQLIKFVKGLATDILNFIKDAILMPIAQLAQGTRGFDLLCAVLGKNPITGQGVPQDANALIGGFMKFIGQQEIWSNMQSAKAVPRAFLWFKNAMATLMGMVKQFPTQFLDALKGLTISDILVLPSAFLKLAAVFGNFAVDFATWAGNAIWNLLEIIFDVVSPGAFSYIKKTGAALKSILKNPFPFLANLVKAAKLGFQNFAANFGGHLKAGLIDWLTGSLPGVYIPKAFSLGEIIKFVFSVLGLTWQNVRGKLVKVVGETAVAAMETGFEIVKTLVTQGPAAAWEQIKDQLANLRDSVIGGITDMVVEMVVTKAVPKLIAMFIPGAGFISAIISIYDTVMVFVNKIKTIIQVVTGFINSIVAIAAGNIGAAAARVESILAGLVSLAINFLAGFAGLGKVADKIMGVINKIRATIDKALDSLIAWIVRMAKQAGKFLKSTAQAVKDQLFEWWKMKVAFSDKKGNSHKLFFAGQGDGARLKVASAEMFTEEFVAKVEAVFAKDNLMKAYGLAYLGQAKQKKVEIDKLKLQLERERKEKSPSAQFTNQKLNDTLNHLSANMRPLFDMLPENQEDDLPAEAVPGKSVTLPYKGTERKADILFASTERVNYEVLSLSAKMALPTSVFKQKWKAGEIRPYIEKGSRETYMGATPGKASATGKKVIARYKTSVNAKQEVLVELTVPSQKLWPLADCDMSHDPIDAVDYWLDTARPNGYLPKGPEIRAWMLDHRNYILESSVDNRRRGSRNKRKYLPP